MDVRAKSVPNDGVGLKKILVFVFDDAEKRESQRNHWGYGVETFFFSRLGFDGRGIGGAASLFSAVLQSHFVTMLFEVRQAERGWKWWPELVGPARLGGVLSDRSDESDESDRSDKSDWLVNGNTRHHSLL
jgi:hypothetical protein